MRGLRVICTRRGFLGASAAGVLGLLATRGAGLGGRGPGRHRQREGARPAWRYRRWQEVVVSPAALGPSGPDLAG